MVTFRKEIEDKIVKQRDTQEKTTHEKELLERQVTPEIAALIEYIFEHGTHEGATYQDNRIDMNMLVNPIEVAALLSIRSNHPVSRSYVKELARTQREITRGEDKKKTPYPIKPRITPVKKAGTAYLYRLEDVLGLPTVTTRSDKKHPYEKRRIAS